MARRLVSARRAAGKGRVSITVFVDPPLAKLAKQFRELSDEVKDFRPAWKKLAPWIAKGIRQLIMSRGSIINEQWPPLSKSYSKRRGSGGRAPATLMRTGYLMAAATSPVKGQGILSIGKKMLRYGVRAPQARAINFGYYDSTQERFAGRSKSKARRVGRMPKRTFIAKTPYIENACISEVNDHVKELIDKHFPVRSGGRAKQALARAA